MNERLLLPQKPVFPYPGLRPFERDENLIFFGREPQISALVDKISEMHFIAVVGKEGSGKSSLVKAGFLHALESGIMGEDRLFWSIVEFTPGVEPFKNFKEKLFKNADIKIDNYDFLLEEGKNSKKIAIKLLSKLVDNFFDNNHQHPSLLLVIDQFEEIFARPYSRAADFIDFMLELLKHPRVYILITMRSRYIDDCSQFAGLSNAINKGLYIITHLSEEQLIETIEKPALITGDEVSKEVINQLVNDMRYSPAKLPLMQHLLARMWRYARNDASAHQQEKAIISQQHYIAAGGIDAALSNHANEIYESLNQEKQTITKILFKNLSERKEGYPDIRRRVVVDDVAQQANTSCQHVIKAANLFRKQGRYLIIPFFESKRKLTCDDILDICHEGLIKNWDRLDQWAEEEKEAAEIYHDLTKRANIWKLNGKLAKDLDTGTKLTIAWEDWYEKIQPSHAWAKRYDGRIESSDFDNTIEFLFKSHKQKLANMTKKWVTVVTIVLFVITFFIMLWVNSTLELHDNKLNQAELLIANNNYLAAQTQLNKARELDNYVWLFSFISRSSTSHLKKARWLDGYSALLLNNPTQQNAIQQTSIITPYDIDITSASNPIVTIASNEGVFFSSIDNIFPLELAKPAASIRNIAVYPDNNVIAAIDNKAIYNWNIDVTTHSLRQRIALEDAVIATTAMAISAQQQLAVGVNTSDGNNRILMFDPTGNPVKSLSGFKESEVLSLAFPATSHQLISGHADKTLKLWDIETGKLLKIRRLFSSPDHLALSPDKQLLAVSTASGTVLLGQANLLGQADLLGQAEAFNLTQELRGSNSPVTSSGFVTIQDDTFLLSASSDKTLRLWDLKSGVTLQVLQGHQAGVNDVAVHEDNAYSVDKDGKLFEWQMQLNFQMVNTEQMPTAVALLENGKHLLAGFENGQLCVYPMPLQADNPICINAHQDRIRRIEPVATPQQWATASFDGTVKVWQLSDNATITALATLKGHQNTVSDIANIPDSEYGYTASYDGQIGLFSDKSLQLLEINHNSHNQAPEVNSVMVSHDKQHLLSASDNDVRLWAIKGNPEQPQPLHTFKVNEIATDAVFSPDNQTLAIIDYNKAVIYDYRKPTVPIKKMTLVAQERIMKAEFTPEGHFLATVSADSTLRLWNLASQDELFTLQLPAEPFPQTEYYSNPVLDFDLHCVIDGACLVAVPLTNRRLVVYNFGDIY